MGIASFNSTNPTGLIIKQIYDLEPQLAIETGMGIIASHVSLGSIKNGNFTEGGSGVQFKLTETGNKQQVLKLVSDSAEDAASVIKAITIPKEMKLKLDDTETKVTIKMGQGLPPHQPKVRAFADRLAVELREALAKNPTGAIVDTIGSAQRLLGLSPRSSEGRKLAQSLASPELVLVA